MKEVVNKSGKHNQVWEHDIWDNESPGNSLPAQGEFTDTGTETHFTLGHQASYIRAESSGNKRKGLLYTLVVGDSQLEPVKETIAEKR